MQTIRDLLSRDLSQPIEEVIKLDQHDERTVYNEITEYVATDRIKRQYMDILQAIADAPGDPTEGVGVWISGFFGSGKSSFAKNLGYVISNRQVLDHPAARLFIQQLEEQSPGDPLVRRIADTVGFINTRFDAHVIMFDVQVDRAVRRSTEPIAEIMYTVLLRELDYAQDYDIAELEIELEGENRLGDFVQTCAAAFGDQVKGMPAESVPVTLPDVPADDYAVWRQVRKGAQRIQRASAVLHEVDPDTYPTPDSWAASLQTKETDVTIRTLVDRTFELTARRRPNHSVMFIIDEVGQYVARSAEKIENLRAVVEHFGQEGKNRILAGKAVAPVWVIVTSQEKLDEVVAAIDDKRVELARLQDRFNPGRHPRGGHPARAGQETRGRACLDGAVREGKGHAPDPHPAGTHRPPERRHRRRVRPVLPLPPPLCGSFHRHRLGHPPAARRPQAHWRLQPHHHQAGLRDAGQRPYRAGRRPCRYARHDGPHL